MLTMMNRRKLPPSNNLNIDFCDFLMQLADYEKNVTCNIHKYNAYRKAVSALSAYGKRIESGQEAKQLEGIGEKIAMKIDEFLQTGKLQKLDNINKDENARAINLLTRVSGIGPVKAAALVKDGIKTLKDLKKNKHKLNHHQNIGLLYFDDFEKKIPRMEVEQIEMTVKLKLLRIEGVDNIILCGSFRRGAFECGDVDILIMSTVERIKGGRLLRIVVKALKDIIIDTISLGETKFMGVCQLDDEMPARRLDIRVIPRENYYCAVLYFTGSDMFNKNMRQHALEKGFTLNEYSLRPIGVTGVVGEPVRITSEEEIFEYIDYPYKRPEARNF